VGWRGRLGQFSGRCVPLGQRVSGILRVREVGVVYLRRKPWWSWNYGGLMERIAEGSVLFELFVAGSSNCASSLMGGPI
jgi:hypothetical protein